QRTKQPDSACTREPRARAGAVSVSTWDGRSTSCIPEPRSRERSASRAGRRTQVSALALPALTDAGDLPLGVHPAPLSEVLHRFGAGSIQRKAVALRLARIHRIAH